MKVATEIPETSNDLETATLTHSLANTGDRRNSDFVPLGLEIGLVRSLQNAN